MPGAWGYGVSASTGWLGVCTWLGEIASLIYNLHLSVAAGVTVKAHLFLRHTTLGYVHTNTDGRRRTFFPSVRGRGCVHSNTDGPGRTEKKMARTKKQKLMLWWWWRRRVNKVHSIRRFSVHPVNRSRHVHGEYHHLIPIFLDDPFKFAEYLRMNTDTFHDLLDECAAELKTTASLVKDTRPHLNCVDQFLVVHAALLCLSRKSNALSKYRNARKVQSLERTDGKDRACTFLRKSVRVRPCQYERFSRHQWE